MALSDEDELLRLYKMFSKLFNEWYYNGFNYIMFYCITSSYSSEFFLELIGF